MNYMNICDQIQELIQKSIDNVITKEEYEQLRKHIENCSSCKNEYTSYNKVSNILKNINIPLPIDFDNKLHKKLLDLVSKDKNKIFIIKEEGSSMINTLKLKKFIHEKRSYIISTGIHLLLLLLFLNIIVMQQQMTTPTFITKIITNKPPEIKKQEIEMKREEQRPDAGSEGLEGLKGGGMSSPKLQQQLMIKQAQVKQVSKVFTPVQNIRTQVKDIFVPKTQIAVKETKVRSDFRVPMQPRTAVNQPISGSVARTSPNTTGTRNTSGMLVPGDYSDSGRPDGSPDGTGIGEQKGGNTGRGGGTGIGFSPFGSGTGSGNQGTGPGAGSKGLGGGLKGTGTGPGSGPGISIAPGGGAGTAIVGSGSNAQPVAVNVTNVNVQTQGAVNKQQIYKPNAPLGSQENPISEISVAVEFNGESGFVHDFYLAYPENKLLVRNARFSRSEIVKLGPYAVPPDQFLFYFDITANQWGLDRGVPLKQTIYTNDPQQVRVRKVSDNTIRYFLEDMPVYLSASDKDYDDVIITIVYKGAGQ
ncbi:MAG: zf-HC2 domain-containing protein [Endomicrobia bacterium]|nr:zf-HC2 domain-containing protein [Endomicrobiia bacterium]